MSEIGKRVTRSDEKELLGQMLAEMRAFRTSTTEAMSRYFGNAINNVLLVETVTFGANGYVTRSTPAPIGAVEVRNLDGTNAVTLAVGGSTGAAPLDGVGVYVIPAGTVQVVNIASTTFTLYGTDTERVSFQAFADGGRDGGS